MSQHTVLAETSALLDWLASQEGPHLAELPVHTLRDVYGQLSRAFDKPLDSSIRIVDFRGPRGTLRAYFPGKPKADPIIVYMHGGGWVMGDLDTHTALCGLIAAVSGLRVVAIDYRLAPEHRFPRAHEDCLASTEFLSSGPAELEAPVTGLAVAGDSAGANLALHVAARLGSAALLGQLLMYPLLDCTHSASESYQQFEQGYLLDRRLLNRFISEYLPGGKDIGHAELSPLLHPLRIDLPPAVVLAAGLDPLRDQGRDLARHLVARGIEAHYIEAKGLIHGMATMRHSLPTADRIIRRVITIFTELIATAQNARGQ
jgi:acetyl esterase